MLLGGDVLVKIISAVLLVLVIFLTYIAIQPSSYLVTREIVIDAPADQIFKWLNNSKKMEEWMPWSEIDRKMVMSYSGPDEGPGSVTSWKSEGQMGVGTSTIIESISNEKVISRLEYVKPFESNQFAEVSVSQFGKKTTVKWSVKGENNFLARIFCTFMNMDKMVGGMFDKGLNNLKLKIEKNKQN